MIAARRETPRNLGTIRRLCSNLLRQSMASIAIPRKMTPTQPIPNFSLLFNTQELKSKITQASFGFPLVVNPCMYMSVPEPSRQNGNGPSFFACLLPATGLVHAFAVLSHGVRAARLVILIFANGCGVGTRLLRNIQAIHPAIGLPLPTLLMHLLLNRPCLHG